MEEKKIPDEEIVKDIERSTGMPGYWKKTVLDLIRRLQYGYSSASKASEEWKAKYEAERKENVEQKAEIERLTEETDKYKGLYETMYRKYYDLSDKEFNCEALRKEKNEYFDKAAELQKQVDELKERAKIDLENEKNWGKIQTKQAVKDTAKEIWNIAYKTACNTRGEITEQCIKEKAKRYHGVEVGE